jgi:tetratricopeptide (TPR) repeat protein
MVFPLKFSVVLSIFLLSFSFVFAQKTMIQTFDSKDFIIAQELFNKQKYVQSQHYFNKIIELKPAYDETRINAEFYAALCAYELFNDDAESRLVLFAKGHPENINAKLCNFYIGNLYYRNRQFKQSLAWFERTELGALSKEQRNEFQFKKGYSYFIRNNFEKAKPLFAEVKDIDNKYAVPATYYYSHIAYLEKKFEIALKGFLKFKNNSTFSPIVPYYVTQIYFSQGKYEEVISYAKPILDSTKNNKRGPEIAHLIGDAYTKIGKYSEAIPYFEKFVKSNNPLFRDDYYEIGFAYYKAKLYPLAIEYLKKSVPNNSKGIDDSLSQITYFNLADCYLQSGSKTFARNAFAEASKMKFDEEISENSLYNYAKLSYETESDPYHDAIDALQKYVNLYPNSPNYDEAFKFLVNAYLASKNYKDALISLDKMKSKTLALQNAYQKIAYTYAIDLFNNQNYVSSIAMLSKALIYSRNKGISAESYYWKAEAFYRLNETDSAINNYKKFLFEPGAAALVYFHNVNYNLGYCSFNKKDYNEASEWFRKFLAFTGELEKKKQTDACLRVADCFYVQTKYLDAVEYYNLALKTALFNNDYAIFQKAMSEGLLNKLDDKIKDLQFLIIGYPKSIYLDDALFELGQAFLMKNDNEKALEYFIKLSQEYENSSLVKKALSKQALIYYNTDKDKEAIDIYESIIEKYPNTEESNQAATKLKNIYVEMGEMSKFETFAAKNPSLNISNAELDSATYESAENLYTKGDCEGSRKQFSAYLNKFENAIFILNANYYKADCDLKAKDSLNALSSFNAIIKQPTNKFTERSLKSAANIYYNQAKYEEATSLFTKLELIADNPTITLEARIGQMRSNFSLREFEFAIMSATKLLEMEKTPNEIKNECHLLKGKSYILLNRDSLALRELNEVLFLKGTEMASEAKYLMAEFYFNKKDNVKSQNIILDLVNEDPGYDYWITKAFLLLSDNFVAVNDIFQAKETLQSIIDNSEEDTAVAEAKAKLQKITDEEKAIEERFKKNVEEIKFDVQEVKDNEEIPEE